MTESELIDLAKSLPCGTSRRVKHCKDDHSMIVSHNLNGVRWHCFRCPESRWIPHGKSSLNEILKREKEYRKSMSGVATLTVPDDCGPVPLQYAHWFMQHGVGYEVATDIYGFGYSPGIGRIIIPVYEDGILTNIHMRATQPGQLPKYITPGAKLHPSAIFWGFQQSKEYSPLVICEDILSAIRVNEVLPACSILGSYMSSDRAYKISTKTDKVYLWLDGDKAGKEGAKQITNQLNLMGVEVVRNIKTSRDPKEYSRDEIEVFLGGDKND